MIRLVEGCVCVLLAAGLHVGAITALPRLQTADTDQPSGPVAIAASADYSDMAQRWGTAPPVSAALAALRAPQAPDAAAAQPQQAKPLVRPPIPEQLERPKLAALPVVPERPLRPEPAAVPVLPSPDQPALTPDLPAELRPAPRPSVSPLPAPTAEAMPLTQAAPARLTPPETTPPRDLRPLATPPPPRAPDARARPQPHTRPDLQPALPDAAAPQIADRLPPDPALAGHRPKARPDVRKPAPQQRKAAPAAKRASPKSAGQAGSSAATTPKANQNAAAKAKEKTLKAKWGARIYQKLQRNMRYPSAGTGVGKVRVTLVVDTKGRRISASFASGGASQAFAAAARQAVKRSGRLPAAPRGMTAGTHRFTITLSFRP